MVSQKMGNMCEPQYDSEKHTCAYIISQPLCLQREESIMCNVRLSRMILTGLK